MHTNTTVRAELSIDGKAVSRSRGRSALSIGASISSIAFASLFASSAQAQIVITDDTPVENPAGQTVTSADGVTQTVNSGDNIELEDNTNDDTAITLNGIHINNDGDDEDVVIFVDNSEDDVIINIGATGVLQGIDGVIFYEGDGAVITNAGRIEGTGNATEGVIYFDRDADGAVNSVTNSGIITGVGGPTIGVDTLLGTDPSSGTVGDEEGIARFTLVNTGTISNTDTSDSDSDAINFNGDPGTTGGAARGCLEDSGARVLCQVEMNITNSGTISAARDNGSNAAIRIEEDVVASGAILNQVGGMITGARNAINVNGAHANHNLTITNAGTITGTSGTGIVISGAGVTVNNQAGGNIIGDNEGILLEGTTITIDIGPSNMNDVAVAASGNTITNAGTISGSDAAITIGANAAGNTVTNDGTFTGSRGFDSESGGTLTNNGTITGTGNEGIRFTENENATVTLGSASTTTGDGDAVMFAGTGTNTLNIAAGATVNGDLQGSAGTSDSLNLSGSGDGGTLQVQDFEVLTAAGGDFILGSDTTGFAQGMTINAGNITLLGTTTGDASVASGATLSGTGTVGGTVTIADGGILAAGNDGAGTLTTGGLVLSSGSIINVDLGDPDDATTSDRIQVNGDLTLDGTLNAADAGDFGIGVYRIIDYTGSLTDNGLLVGAVPTGFTTDQTEVQTSVGNQVNLIVAASIPDIQFWDGSDTAADSAIDGGAGSWNLTDTNWTNGDGDANAAWNSNFAVFAGTAGTVTVDDAITFTGLQFMTDGYTIASGSGALTISEAETNVRVDPGVTATISAPIGGTGGINQLDSGTLILTGDHTYTGNTAVGGTLVLNGSIAGDASVASGATLSGTGTAGGTVTIANGGILAAGNDGAGTLTTGGLVLSSGSIINVDLGDPGDASTSDRIQVNGDLTLDGTLNAVDAGDFGIGVYRIVDYTGTLTNNGLLVGTLPTGFITDQAEVQTSIGSQVNLIISGIAPDIQFWDGSDTTADSTIDGGAGSWNLTDTNWTNGPGDENTAWNSLFAIFAGTAGTVTVDDAITFTGLQFMTDGYTIATGTGGLTITEAETNVRVDSGVTATISAPIGGTGGINQLDSGTLILTGANTYTGNTAVGGTLVLNGSIAGDASVSGGATLSGTGTAGGTVTIADGGILAAGDDGAGTLTTGGLVLSSGSLINVDLGDPDDATTSDRIQVNGDLTLDGTLNAADAGDFGIGVYRIIDYTGALTDNGLLVGAVPTGFTTDQTEVQTSVGNQVNLIVAANIPDIQFWDGADTAADSTVDGGTSIWDLTGTNWTNGDGDANAAWNSNFAVFAGTAGTVTVDDAITFTGLQFMTDGYTIASGSGALTISEAATNVRVDSGVTATISAPIGGTGGINQLDSGTLILTGANTYTGNTAVGGTLVLNGSIAGDASVSGGATLSGTGTAGGTVTIANGGILAAGDDGAGTLTTGGLVLSSGSIINVDLGDPDDATTSDRIQVNGDLTLDGTLNAVDAGDFGIGVYRIIDYTGSLTDNGLLVGAVPTGFTADQTEVQTSVGNQVNLIVAANIPDIQFWDGADTAADSTVDGGAGSWNLTDTNWTNGDGDANAAWNSNFAVFAGSAGTVTVDDAITFTGLQFMTDGYTIASGSGALTISEAETNVRVDPGVTATISAPIGGTGGINQLDSGTLILTGDHTYTGATTVNTGSLVLNGSIVSATTVNADGMVSGTGQFGDLTIAGTIAPGVNNIGTLNVAGDIGFAAGSQYNVEVLPDGSNDLIAATGAAAINGGTVNVLAGGTQYDLSTDYTILTAGGGVNGTFDSVNSNLAFLTPTLSYEANSVLLNLTRNNIDFADVGQTANQKAAGAAIQSQGSSVLGNQIVNLDAATALDAFDQLSGELHPTVRTVMSEDNRLVRNAVLDHLTENEGGTIWGDIWGTNGDSDGDSNAAGLSRDGYGLLMGADVSIGEGSSMGIVGSYSETDIDLDERTGSGTNNFGSGTVQTFNVAGYVGVDLGGMNLRVGGGYGWSDVETNRSVAFNTFADTLTASYGGSTIFGFSELGYRFDVGSGYAEPYLGATFIEANTDEFAENGGDAALRATGEIENSLISTMGVRFGTSKESAFRLRGKAGWQHGFGDLTPNSTVRFGTGSNFTTAGAPQSGDAGFIQLEGVYKLSEGAEIGISYDGIYGDASQDHAAMARITIGF